MARATKTLGILGGMSWVSTQEYYRLINLAVAAGRGGQHSADLLIASLDFAPLIAAQSRGDWSYVNSVLAAKAAALAAGGASALLIACNTMHLALAAVAEAAQIPVLSIFDATAAALNFAGYRRIGLLGSRYTMSDPFFRLAYESRGFSVLVPPPAAARRVNAIIFRELIHNQITAEARDFYRSVVASLASAGAEAVVLGCTEIGLLLSPAASPTPLFDTTALHAASAAAWLMDP